MLAKCVCGGERVADGSICRNSSPCQHDAHCFRCGAVTRVYGGGGIQCAPYFDSNSEACEASQVAIKEWQESPEGKAFFANHRGSVVSYSNFPK
jgi:hypothetical protein